MKIVLLGMFSFLLVSCSGWKHTSTFAYEEFSAKDYEQKLKENKDYIIVDVRTPSEYRKGHMANAVNISYFGSGFSKEADKLPKDKLIFMYCQTQHRSPLASRVMKKEGFTHIIDLKGGFMKWEHQNMPMVN